MRNNKKYCPICGHESVLVGEKSSSVLDRVFELFRCDNCYFAFVGNPCVDYESIYDESYYSGKGADRKVDYIGEMATPATTIRRLEWQGLKLFADAQSGIVDILDYGCGSGLLPSYLKKNGYASEGWDTGCIASKGRNYGFPVLREKPTGETKKYDLIFAIEVIEHIPNPLELFSEFRSLLRPGGIVFVTTGNAMPRWNKLIEWEYFIPEIHISLFTPNSLKLVFEKSGFTSVEHKYSDIFENIVLYKILKNLYFRELNWKSRLLMETLRPLCKFIDKKYGVSAIPFGIAK